MRMLPIRNSSDNDSANVKHSLTTATTMASWFNWTSENSTMPPPPTLTASELVRSVLLFCMMIISLGANAATLVSTYRRRHRQICINLLILHLCFADLLVTIFGLGANAVWMLTVSWKGGTMLCKLVKYCEACGLYASAFIVTVISIDRCLAVIDPLALGAANKRTKVMILIAWSIATVFSIPQVLVFSVIEAPFSIPFEQCVTFENLAKDLERWYLIFTIVTQFVAPLSVMVISYSLILQTVCRKLKEYARSEQNALQASERSSTYTPTDTLCTANVNGHCGMRTTQVGVFCNSATGGSAISTRTMQSGGPLRPQTGVVFRRARNKSMKIATAIVCTFVLSWTPYFASYAYFVLFTSEDGTDARPSSNATATGNVPISNDAAQYAIVDNQPSADTGGLLADVHNWLAINWYLVLEFFHRSCCVINPLIYGAVHLKLRTCAKSKKRGRRKGENDADGQCSLCLPMFKMATRNACVRAAADRFKMPICAGDRRRGKVQVQDCRCTLCAGWRARGCECQLQRADNRPFCVENGRFQHDDRVDGKHSRQRGHDKAAANCALPFGDRSRKLQTTKLAVADSGRRACEVAAVAVARQYDCAYNYCRLRQFLNPAHECAHLQLRPEERAEQRDDKNSNRCEAVIELPSLHSPATV